jgi:hypothetical protein
MGRDCRLLDAACIRPRRAAPARASQGSTQLRAGGSFHTSSRSVWCVCGVVLWVSRAHSVAVCVWSAQRASRCVITWCCACRVLRCCSLSALVYGGRVLLGRPLVGLTSRPSARRCSTISGGSIACDLSIGGSGPRPLRLRPGRVDARCRTHARVSERSGAAVSFLSAPRCSTSTSAMLVRLAGARAPAFCLCVALTLQAVYQGLCETMRALLFHCVRAVPCPYIL